MKLDLFKRLGVRAFYNFVKQINFVSKEGLIELTRVNAQKQSVLVTSIGYLTAIQNIAFLIKILITE